MRANIVMLPYGTPLITIFKIRLKRPKSLKVVKILINDVVISRRNITTYYDVISVISRRDM